MPRKFETKEQYNAYYREYMLARYHNRRAAAVAQLGGACAVCGTTDKLEFDHIDPKTKSHNIARIMTSGNKVMLQEELSKCQLLCSKHHKEKSADGWDYHHTRYSKPA